LKNAHLLRFSHPSRAPGMAGFRKAQPRAWRDFARLNPAHGGISQGSTPRMAGFRKAQPRAWRDFARLNLHLGIFEQPAGNPFFQQPPASTPQFTFGLSFPTGCGIRAWILDLGSGG